MNDGTQPVVWYVIERHKDRAGNFFRQPREGEEFHLKRWAHISQDVKTWDGEKGEDKNEWMTLVWLQQSRNKKERLKKRVD